MSMEDCLQGVDQVLIDEMSGATDKVAKLSEMELRAKRSKKLIAMQKGRHEELIGRIMNHQKGEVSGIRSILANDVYGLETGSNVEYRTKAITGMAHSEMMDVFNELHNTAFGLKRKNVALADDMIRELFGTGTGNKKARKLADQWLNVSEKMRTRYNDAGGAIGKLDTWGMPQSHAQHKVAKIPREEWKSFIEPKLANADEVDLDFIYDTITTGGANKVDTKKPRLGGGKMLANRNAEERILHFKDGDAWLEYNKAFGNSDDPLSVFTDHIRRMATDTSLLEIMGPNPDSMFRMLADEVKRMEALGTNKQKGFEGYTEALYNVVSGKVDESAAATTFSRGMQQNFETMRALQTASKLGSATLSAVSDLGTLMVNTKYHGMDISKVLKTMMKNFNPQNQVQIAKLGFAADIFNSTLSQRYTELGRGWSSQASEAVMRASGLSIWTEAANKAFQFELYSHLGRIAGNMQAGMKQDYRLFRQYGWSKDEILALDFDNLSQLEQTRLLEMVNQEGEYAVMQGNARARAVTTGGMQKGTAGGELIRSAMQFKTFPATFMIQQLGRTVMQGDNFSKFKYGAGILTSTTIMGAIAMMAKDATKGYTPRDGSPLDENAKAEDYRAFWGAAVLQGGGAGILGDLLFTDQSRAGSIAATLAGPSLGTVERAYGATVGQTHKLAEGKSTTFGGSAVDFVNREVNPLNLWYTKALIEKYVVNNIKEIVDKDYKKNKRKQAKRRKKAYGQEKMEFFK